MVVVTVGVRPSVAAGIAVARRRDMLLLLLLLPLFALLVCLALLVTVRHDGTRRHEAETQKRLRGVDGGQRGQVVGDVVDAVPERVLERESEGRMKGGRGI